MQRMFLSVWEEERFLIGCNLTTINITTMIRQSSLNGVSILFKNQHRSSNDNTNFSSLIYRIIQLNVKKKTRQNICLKYDRWGGHDFSETARSQCTTEHRSKHDRASKGRTWHNWMLSRYFPTQYWRILNLELKSVEKTELEIWKVAIKRRLFIVTIQEIFSREGLARQRNIYTRWFRWLSWDEQRHPHLRSKEGNKIENQFSKEGMNNLPWDTMVIMIRTICSYRS